MSMFFHSRFIPLWIALFAALLFGAAAAAIPFTLWLAIPLAVSIALVLIGLYDLVQQHHSILRNYPLSAHMRFIFEAIRPELRQYFFEGDKDGTRSAATAAPSSTSAPRCSSMCGRSAASTTSTRSATSGCTIRSRRGP
jgi:hypothetical protein